MGNVKFSYRKLLPALLLPILRQQLLDRVGSRISRLGVLWYFGSQHPSAMCQVPHLHPEAVSIYLVILFTPISFAGFPYPAAVWDCSVSSKTFYVSGQFYPEDALDRRRQGPLRQDRAPPQCCIGIHPSRNPKHLLSSVVVPERIYSFGSSGRCKVLTSSFINRKEANGRAILRSHISNCGAVRHWQEDAPSP